MTADTKETILLVEDEAGFRQIYRDVLAGDGYKVLEAEDGQVGLDILREHRPDLVLLDLILPRMSGYDLLKAVRADESLKNTPVIIFSVLENSEDIKKSIQMGATDYIVKGFEEPRHVTEKIRAVLDRTAASRHA